MNSLEKFEEKLSFWAFKHCRDVEDNYIIRKYITNSYDAYLYCRDINDDPVVRQYINDSFLAYLYCKNIKYNEELAKISNKGGLDV